MIKKLIVLLLVLSLSVSMLVGCTTGKDENGNGDKTEKVKVALVTSSGGLGDRSFNDAAW